MARWRDRTLVARRLDDEAPRQLLAGDGHRFRRRRAEHRVSPQRVLQELQLAEEPHRIQRVGQPFQPRLQRLAQRACVDQPSEGGFAGA